MLELNEIQGLIFSGYATQTEAVYLLTSGTDAHRTKQWLGQLLTEITFYEKSASRDRKTSINLAISFEGFKHLEFSESTLDSFPTAFIEDMSQPNRVRVLGDPLEREWGNPGHKNHFLIMLFSIDDPSLTSLLQEQKQNLAKFGLKVEKEISSAKLKNDREHFGFADGLSQPAIKEMLESEHKLDYDNNDIRAGEFILGYRNEYDEKTLTPKLRGSDTDPKTLLPRNEEDQCPDLGKNGTFLVMRQIEQDVPKFWSQIRIASTDINGKPDEKQEKLLAAKIVGRWEDGTPLTMSAEVDGLGAVNNFLYRSEDSAGNRCPFGSHIRRANPRDSLLKDEKLSQSVVRKHRIIRRGRPYGPALKDRYTGDDKKRGLVFICLNANIERQFEFIQNAWISSSTFLNSYDEGDPLMGGRVLKAGVYSVQASPIRRRYQNLQSCTKLIGGGYFFLPSRACITYLSEPHKTELAKSSEDAPT